ncbi:hypothetical protein C8J57DRAFT_1716907 [Mycena rebaudengoi]|nr:hypothetical protein C8J57DRAFT_1716907 [Mycena rebaudengoi]
MEILNVQDHNAPISMRAKFTDLRSRSGAPAMAGTSRPCPGLASLIARAPMRPGLALTPDIVLVSHTPRFFRCLPCTPRFWFMLPAEMVGESAMAIGARARHRIIRAGGVGTGSGRRGISSIGTFLRPAPLPRANNAPGATKLDDMELKLDTELRRQVNHKPTSA